MNTLYALLFLASLTALIVGLFKPRWMIRWDTGEEPTKGKVLKYYGLSTVVLFVLFSVTTPKVTVEEEHAIVEPLEEEVAQDIEETKEGPVEKPEEKQEEKPEINIEELEQSSLAIIKKNFSDSGTVEFDKDSKMFTITPTSPEFMSGMLSASAGNQEVIDAWSGMVESFRLMSETISLGLPGYKVAVINPDNTDNFVLMIQDGVIIYDVLDN